MVSLLALALFGLTAETAGAQERGFGGAAAGYVATGVSAIATGELDDQLAARGYPTLGRTTAALGVGAYLILPGGMMLGGEWQGLIMGEEPHQGGEVGLGGGYGTLGLGYAVEVSPRTRIYPRLGLGIGGLGLWIESDGEEVPFEEVLANPDVYSDPNTEGDPDSEFSLSRASAVVDLGGGAELLPGGWGRGLLIGLRVGYLVAPFTTTWQLAERRVSGGPAASIAGPYIRLVVGGGPRW